MKIVRAVGIGTVIWALGVSCYSLSFYAPVLNDPELQANMVLFIMVIPLVWFGSHWYHKKDTMTHGFKVGLTFLLTSATLDAMITVPVLIMPNGGSHYEFFTDLGFWGIALEFIATAVGYWYTKIDIKTQKSI